jgi:hypothetical protein
VQTLDLIREIDGLDLERQVIRGRVAWHSRPAVRRARCTPGSAVPYRRSDRSGNSSRQLYAARTDHLFFSKRPRGCTSRTVLRERTGHHDCGCRRVRSNRPA